MNPLSLVPLYRSSIGFDRFSDMFESVLSIDTVSYPPYNVVKKGGDDYLIEIAAAGMTEADLDIKVEKDVLTIVSTKREAPNETQYLHRGIAQRAFKLTFRLADYIEVRDASLKNGLLGIQLVRNVPEAVKPRRIAVSSSHVTPISKAA